MTVEFQPQFINRSNEVNVLLENIHNKKISIIEGEEGVGKSTILNKIYNILENDYSDSCFVGYYDNDKAFIGKTISEASIFIVLLEDLLEWINQKFFLKGKIIGEKDKLKKVLINLGKKRGTKIAKILVRDILHKLGLGSLEEIIEEFGKEYNQEKSIFDMSEDYIDSVKSNTLILNGKEILNTFINVFNNKKFIFIIDRFESLNENTIDLFLNLMKLTEFHFIVSITKYKNYGNASDRKRYENIIKACNTELDVKWINIIGLTQENIKEWIKIVRNRKLLDIEIKSIWEKTSGLPVILESWINRSTNLDITEIDVDQFCRSIILQYLDIDTNIISKINKLSILKYPFEINTLIKYLNLSSYEEYNVLSDDLVKFGIFDKNKGWFRNEVIQNCFRNNIIDQQRIIFHKEATGYYETIVTKDLHLTRKETLINLIEYSFHLHYGQFYEKSYFVNRKAAYEMERMGDLSTAEDCLRRCIIDSEKLNDLNKKMKTIFLLSSQILIVNGEYDEAQKNFDKLFSYYEEIDDEEMQFNVLNSMARLLRIRGKYNEALEKYEQNLQIATKNNNLDHIAASLNNMGVVNRHLLYYDIALDNYQTGLFIALIIGNDKKIATGLHNIGIMHDILGEHYFNDKKYDLAFKEFDKALNLYQQCYNIEEKLDNEMGKSEIKNDIGMIYLHKDEYDKALSYFEESLALKQKIGHYEGIYNTLYNIGLVYIDKKNFDKALPYLDDALDMAKTIGNQKEIDKVNHEIDKIKKEGII